MTRESAEAKGRRYATEGRLCVHSVTTTTISATIRGNAEVYDVGYERGSWNCSCPAPGRCSHLVALQLVTVAPPVRRLAEAASA
jgi:uncharacterized Zn finger protein